MSMGSGRCWSRRPSASIERAVNAQSKLIDDLLDVSRIVSGKLTLDLGPVDFAAIVEEAVDIARLSAQAKALELDLSVDHNVGTVYGDHARLLQVVNNLLENATQFTPHNGRITVHLERVNERAELNVTDTGMGIHPDVLPQLFDRFVQADSAVTRTHGGLGLGLSIVRHVVEDHGGTVHAESRGEGHGSTFRVTLPVGADIGRTHAVARRVAVRDVENVRVLLVEDDDDTREAYAAMLVQLGATVRAAQSAAEALADLRKFRPQVILSDIAMPGEDGFSFIQKVRSLAPEEGGRVPAAAVTALASNEDRRRALQAGFQMHVRKPVDAAELVLVVVTFIDGEPLDSSAQQDRPDS
jgi:CheY-like chemotaxis protein/two-component sensor histidine kinase